MTKRKKKVKVKKPKKRYAYCNFCGTLAEFKQNPELMLDPGCWRCETCGCILEHEPVWAKGG